MLSFMYICYVRSLMAVNGVLCRFVLPAVVVVFYFFFLRVYIYI